MQLSAADKAVGVHRNSKLQSNCKRAGGWMQFGVRAICVSRRNTQGGQRPADVVLRVPENAAAGTG